jgi:hypothetical protein
MTDPLLRILADLPQPEPDRARAARVRARCHAALARSGQLRAPRPSGSPRLWETLLAVLGGAYLIETVRQALLVFGLV